MNGQARVCGEERERASCSKKNVTQFRPLPIPMPCSTHILFLLVVFFACCLPHSGVYAFGAGNIPSCVFSPFLHNPLSPCPRFSYIEGKAFRHGDIVRSAAFFFLLHLAEHHLPGGCSQRSHQARRQLLCTHRNAEQRLKIYRARRQACLLWVCLISLLIALGVELATETGFVITARCVLSAKPTPTPFDHVAVA